MEKKSLEIQLAVEKEEQLAHLNVNNSASSTANRPTGFTVPRQNKPPIVQPQQTLLSDLSDGEELYNYMISQAFKKQSPNSMSNPPTTTFHDNSNAIDSICSEFLPRLSFQQKQDFNNYRERLQALKRERVEERIRDMMNNDPQMAPREVTPLMRIRVCDCPPSVILDNMERVGNEEIIRNKVRISLVS